MKRREIKRRTRKKKRMMIKRKMRRIGGVTKRSPVDRLSLKSVPLLTRFLLTN